MSRTDRVQPTTWWARLRARLVGSRLLSSHEIALSKRRLEEACLRVGVSNSQARRIVSEFFHRG